MALVYDANGFNVTATGILANGATSKTLDMGEGTWTVSGNIQLSSGMTFTPSTSTVTVNETSTIKTGGKAFSGFTFGATKTYTLGDDLNVDGTLTIGSGFTATVNSNSIKASAGITLGNETSVLAGSATLLYDGTGTLTGNSGTISTNWTINTGGTLTLSGIIKYDTGTLTYTAGTVDAGTSTLSIVGSCTLNTDGIDWYTIAQTNGIVVTLTSDITITNDVTSPGASGFSYTWNGYTMHIKGDYNGGGTNTTFTLFGTTTYKVDGSGDQLLNINTRGVGTRYIQNPFIIESTGGTVTMDSEYDEHIDFRGGFTYVSGTVDWTTHGITAYFGATQNVDSGTMSFYKVNIYAGTVTLTGNMIVGNTLTINASSTLALGSNTLMLKGDFINNGTFTPGTGKVVVTS